MEKEENKKINIKENLKIYFSFLFKYKFIVVAIILLIIIKEIEQVANKYVVKIGFDRASDFISGSLSSSELIKIIAIISVVLILMAIIISFGINWLYVHLLNRIEAKMVYDMKEKYFSHIISLDNKFFATHKTGSLISRMSRSGSAIERMSDAIFFQFLSFIFQFVILIGSLIYLDKSSAIVISIVIILFISSSIGLQKTTNTRNEKANQSEDREKANVADMITNIDSVKYFGKDNLVINKYLSYADDTKNTAIKSWDMWKISSSLQGLVLGLGTAALIFFSFKSFANGNITLGTLSFIYSTYFGITRSMFGFIFGFRDMNRSMTDLQDLFEYGKVKSSIVDKKNAPQMKISKGEIEFDSVDFSYDRRSIFKNFSLKIPANKKVAFVGISGSGKTTLIKLIYRLYDVNSGSIKIDGEDIRDVKQESLREEMSIVPQEGVLFDDTIYNNIKFSKPNASHKEIMHAIKLAQLESIISKFPQKENTIVGERGVKLSGGEKQRVSIARAILANKKIIVLDEATSALDSETENEIQMALKELMKNRTSIVIAHRLSTIISADTIVVIKDGKIVQKGKHKDLINKEGEYKKLWKLQKGGCLR